MKRFVIGAYIILTAVIGYGVYVGIPWYIAPLFYIFPTVMFVQAHFLEKRRRKDMADALEAQARAERDHKASMEIVRTVTDTYVPGSSFADVIRDLDRRLEAEGLELHCDMAGYTAGTETVSVRDASGSLN